MTTRAVRLTDDADRERQSPVRRLLMMAAAVALLIPASAQAHVSIWPRESTARATEKYVVRVPAEGKVASTSLELVVPEGVTVETLAVPAGWKQEVKRQDARLVGIIWQMDIKPGEFAEFAFVARNPRDKIQLVWSLRQHFVDGTVTDFTTGPQGTRPTAVTKLAPMKTP